MRLMDNLGCIRTGLKILAGSDDLIDGFRDACDVFVDMR